MYDFLRGTVASLDTTGRLSLEVNGVGYSLRISEQTRKRISLDGSSVLIYVRLIVRASCHTCDEVGHSLPPRA